MKRIVILLALLFLINSCSSPEPRHIQLVNKIVDVYSSELKSKKKMWLVGWGGSFMDDVKVVCVNYISFEACTVGEARRLYVAIVEKYLKRINENEEIRQYLQNYPFTINNLMLTIAFNDIPYHRRQDGYVGFMFVKHGNLYYQGYDEDNKVYTIYEEPYSESVQIVASGKNLKTVDEILRNFS